MRRLFSGSLVLAALASAPTTASASSVLFTGTGPGANGVTLNASALFSIAGNALLITLKNTGDNSAALNVQDVPGNQLTGVFFKVGNNNITLTPVNAFVDPGAIKQTQFCDVTPCDASTTNVGGEYRYQVMALPGGADRGIASSGYIGGNPNFNGPNLQDPMAVDGINFGIIAPGPPSEFNPNGGLATRALIQNEVRFWMNVSGGALDTDAITNVSFQYGTGLNEPRIPGNGGTPVPEPASLALLVTGLGLVARRGLRRNH